MWMMGYNEVPLEDHDPINMVESNYSTNNGRRFRPLVPRPPPPTCAAASSSANRFHSTHHDHLIPFNHNLADQQNKREFNSQQMVVVSSRWNPTPEQLQTLEELYRRGTRTPSADEIQHITAQLRRYGKIEGKNVFYWFQNHKARERQKRRRQLDNPTTNVHQPPFFATDINTIQCKDNSEVEETRNWAIPTFSEKSVLSERAGKSESRMTNIAAAAADRRWIPVEQQQQQQQQEDDDEEEEGGVNDQVLLVHRRRKNFPARNSTWHDMMQSLSSSSSTPTTNHNIPLINSTCCTPSTLITTSASKTASSIVVSSHNLQHQFQHHEIDCYQTLELFPVNSKGHAGVEQPTEKCFVPTSDVSHSPRQFIEFLPLKN